MIRRGLALVCAFGAVVAGTAWAGEAPVYSLQATYAVGGEGRWDFVLADAASRRLYVPRSTHVQVCDLDTGRVLADIPDTPGVHGVAIAPDQKLGFTSNGKDNTVSVFDVATYKVSRTIKVGVGPDAILYDPASRHILVINHRGGDVSVIDPAALDKAPVSIQVGGALECAVADGRGHVYLAVEDKSEMVAIDSHLNTVLAHWSLAPGEEPTGVALDAAHRLVFAGCANQKAVVLDADTGKLVTTVSVGQGVDGAEFDAVGSLLFIPNGRDGTLSVIAEIARDHFEVVQTVATLPGARTLHLDTATHRLLLPCNKADGKGGQAFVIAVVGPASLPTPAAGPALARMNSIR